MCQWLETIALLDGIVLNLNYHQERIRKTLIAHEAVGFIDLSAVIHQYDLPQRGYYKLRVVYDACGVTQVSWALYAPKQWKSFEIIEAPELNYEFKSTDRDSLIKLKGMSCCDEIIISRQGLITDTTYSNLVFEKDGAWFTPSSYLLAGTQRKILLDRGIIKEASITLGNLTSFQNFKLINAMMPFDSSFTYAVELIEQHNQLFFSPSRY